MTTTICNKQGSRNRALFRGSQTRVMNRLQTLEPSRECRPHLCAAVAASSGAGLQRNFLLPRHSTDIHPRRQLGHSILFFLIAVSGGGREHVVRIRRAQRERRRQMGESELEERCAATTQDAESHRRWP